MFRLVCLLAQSLTQDACKLRQVCELCEFQTVGGARHLSTRHAPSRFADASSRPDTDFAPALLAVEAAAVEAAAEAISGVAGVVAPACFRLSGRLLFAAAVDVAAPSEAASTSVEARSAPPACTPRGFVVLWAEAELAISAAAAAAAPRAAPSAAGPAAGPLMVAVTCVATPGIIAAAAVPGSVAAAAAAAAAVAVLLLGWCISSHAAVVVLTHVSVNLFREQGTRQRGQLKRRRERGQPTMTNDEFDNSARITAAKRTRADWSRPMLNT